MKINKGTKIALDIVMTILLVLMNDKLVLGLAFHEIGGLILLILFLVHNILNFKWTKATIKNAIKNKLSRKIKFSLVLNTLLMISFLLVGISGVLISKKILISISSQSNIWKFLHIGSASLSIILIGIHLGLHWVSIKNKIKFIHILSTIPRRTLKALIVVVILTASFVSFKQTNFIRNIKMPVVLIDTMLKSDMEVTSFLGQENTGKMKRERMESLNYSRDRFPSISLNKIVIVFWDYLSILSVFTLFTYYITKLLNYGICQHS